MTVHPGWELLNQIRSFADEEKAALAPRTTERFDGAERSHADPEAIELHRIMAGIGALCDVVASHPDQAFALRVAKRLERAASGNQ